MCGLPFHPCARRAWTQMRCWEAEGCLLLIRVSHMVSDGSGAVSKITLTPLDDKFKFLAQVRTSTTIHILPVQMHPRTK